MQTDGALAQLGERLLCKHQVIGSIPIGSTNLCLGQRLLLFAECSSAAERVRVLGFCAP